MSASTTLQTSTSAAQRARRWGAPVAILAGALLLRAIAGVGFVNYDTLYALAWGGQLERGEAPAYEVAIAPTPHPLLEALGFVLAPLGPRAADDATVALAFLALAACGWVIYRLGSEWFGRAAGALAALLFLTRVPVLSYGVRAYVDIPYLLLVLWALLIETRHRRAGAPVLALLALAGLLRPEAWAFSGLYWLYLMDFIPRWLRGGRERLPPPPRGRLLRLTLLAAAAPLVWLASDLAITGDPLWSLTNTRHTASTLGRVKGIANVPQYVPRRIGEILRPPVLAAAALGGVLTLMWLRGRALAGAVAGVIAVLVFAAFAAVGLPIDTRYAFPAAAILCIFARSRRVRLDAPAARRQTAATLAGGGGARAGVGARIRALAVPRGAPRTGQTRAPASDRRRPARARVGRCHHAALRPGGRAQPRTGPVARAVPEDESCERGEPRERAHRTRRVRRSGEQGGGTGLRPRPPRSPRARERSAGLHRAQRQPLVADLRPLPLADRAPRVEALHAGACRRPWLRPGSSRCACR